MKALFVVLSFLICALSTEAQIKYNGITRTVPMIDDLFKRTQANLFTDCDGKVYDLTAITSWPHVWNYEVNKKTLTILPYIDAPGAFGLLEVSSSIQILEDGSAIVTQSNTMGTKGNISSDDGPLVNGNPIQDATGKTTFHLVGKRPEGILNGDRFSVPVVRMGPDYETILGKGQKKSMPTLQVLAPITFDQFKAYIAEPGTRLYEIKKCPKCFGKGKISEASIGGPAGRNDNGKQKRGMSLTGDTGADKKSFDAGKVEKTCPVCCGSGLSKVVIE
jgi:hypothetical protein